MRTADPASSPRPGYGRRRPPGRGPCALDHYLDHPRQRWDEGQHSAKILHEDLQIQDCLGHYQRVEMATAPLPRMERTKKGLQPYYLAGDPDAPNLYHLKRT
ncbi:hypothetical protein ACGF8B_38270 [Streptomyces sp. NPDC047917]|uniref:hypothetical protein n=1 Tax=Streptomyces sp. NPDC047917 TaxID=3365491 RepID=UPI00371A85E4